MRHKLFWFVVVLFVFTGFFKTGCGPKVAHAVNVMLTKSFSFTIINDIVVTEIEPAQDATGVSTNTSIKCRVAHTLPITFVTMVVKENEEPVPGTVTVTDVMLSSDKRVEFVPDQPFGSFSNVAWDVSAEVENGQ